MNYSLERLFRTSSSEKYRWFFDRQAYADINIHYGERIKVEIILLNTAAEDVDEGVIKELKNILTTQVILSHSSYIEEIEYNIYVGRRVATTTTSTPNEIPTEIEIKYT